MAEQTPQVLAVGDYVRMRSRDNNQHQSYTADAAEVAFFREPIDGLVLAIRDVQTGQLVEKTAKPLDQYVIELVYNRTFNPKYASLRNAPRGVDDPAATASFRRLRATLRKSAEEGKLYTSGAPAALAESPLANLMDGWKVVKIWSTDMESLEKPAAQEAPAE